MIEETLKEFFMKDPYYVDNLHIEAGKGLDACVAFNTDALKGHTYELFRQEDKGFFILVEDPFFTETNLNLFFVSPEHRKNGTKEMLLRQAIEIAGERGLVSIVPQKNDRIVRFYSKFGDTIGQGEAFGQSVTIIKFRQGN